MDQNTDTGQTAVNTVSTLEESRPSIDVNVLLSRCLGSASFALELLVELETTGSPQVEKAIRHISSRNLPGATAAAHSLKGTAGIIGAERLHEIAAQLETAGRANDSSRVGVLAQELQVEMARCLNQVHQLRADLQQISSTR